MNIVALPQSDDVVVMKDMYGGENARFLLLWLLLLIGTSVSQNVIYYLLFLALTHHVCGNSTVYMVP